MREENKKTEQEKGKEDEWAKSINTHKPLHDKCKHSHSHTREDRGGRVGKERVHLQTFPQPHPGRQRRKGGERETVDLQTLSQPQAN